MRFGWIDFRADPFSTSFFGPIILVGHSYGGAVITNVGVNAPNLLSLVYTTAFAPEAGESIADINARFSGHGSVKAKENASLSGEEEESSLLMCSCP